MSAEFPITDDARHVDAFLRKIDRHRERELNEINAQVAAEVVRIRRRAYADARQLARRVAVETRDREARQTDRYLYKVRSDLTRERWHILQDIRGRVVDDVQQRFDSTWADETRQWQWCHFWIAAAKKLAAPDALKIQCGAGTAHGVAEKIRGLLEDYPGQVDLRIDAGAAPGLLVEWQDHLLDGTLARQRDAVVETVLRQVGDILDGRQPTDSAPP